MSKQNRLTGTSLTASAMPCLRRRYMTSWNGRRSPGRVGSDHLALQDRLAGAQPGGEQLHDVGKLGRDALQPAGEQLQPPVGGAVGLHPHAVVLVLGRAGPAQ